MYDYLSNTIILTLLKRATFLKVGTKRGGMEI
jgi:hypothetical protein